MKVIGTAGHVDHGKSTLVQRLTGIDPDRLAEEKRRGMTIDLGFAWLSLPSGVDASIVDVPGHERFVKNMLAGAGGIDVGLLVIAADEGVMPQTREHVAILDLLEVTNGVVAITKSDLVDNEWLQLVIEESRELLVGTALESAATVAVSATSGAGIDTLLQTLDRVIAITSDPVDRGLPFLPVDRVFTVSGFGTVATGTLHHGHITVGDELEVVPGLKRARIRGLQMHQRQVERAAPGTRVAANLAGIDRHELVRGDVMAVPNTVRAVNRADVRVRVPESSPMSLSHNMEVTVHIGSAERAARLVILEGSRIDPGQSGWAQLQMRHPVAAIRGQRFILRLPSPIGTLAGGEVVDIAPRHRRTDLSVMPRLAGLNSRSLKEAALSALPKDRPGNASQVAVALGITGQQSRAVLQELRVDGAVIGIGSEIVTRNAWGNFADRVQKIVSNHHAAYPLKRGIPKEELRKKLGWPEAVWQPALAQLMGDNVVLQAGSSVFLPSHVGGSTMRSDEVTRVLAVLRSNPFSPPSGAELITAAQTDDELLSAMAEENSIVRLEVGLFLARDAYDAMLDTTLNILRSEGEVSVARIRDAFHTSRKYAVAFLEQLDTARITRRSGDIRVLGSRAPSCK